MRIRTVRKSMVAGALVAALALASGCGGGDDDFGLGDAINAANDEAGNGDGDVDDFADAMNDAMGAGGGGMLVFDSAEYPIESVICANSDGRTDIGTVGEGYRVFVSGDPADLSLQILDPNGIQWFDGDTQQNNKAVVTVEGNTYVSTSTTWWNNQDDRVIEASFTIECP